MNPRDRFIATLKGEKHDRVPIMLRDQGNCTREEIEEIDDPGYREIAERTFDDTIAGISIPTRFHLTRYMALPKEKIRVVKEEEKGQNIVTAKEIDTPKGVLKAITGRNRLTNTTWHIEYPVKSLKDIDKICSIPWAEICANRVMAFLDQLFKENDTIEYVNIGGCEWLTPPMGSPKLYDELIQTWEAPLIERIHEAGAFAKIHCHGNVGSTLEKMVERGADPTEPVEPPPDGDIAFAEAKKLVRGRMVLGGNVEARILEREDEDAVEKATRAAFEGGKRHMVLMNTARPVGRMTPKIVANYHRFIEVWEELSPIDN